MYPKTESHTLIHMGGGLVESHFGIEILLKLDNQVIQIKALVCDSECPYILSAIVYMARLCLQAVVHPANIYTTNS